MRVHKILIAGFICLLFLIGCRPIQNYEEENAPYFANNYAPLDTPFDGNLKVVTWNIKFAEEIDQAIKELQEVEELRDADVLLLQEMDETAVDKIAQELHLNYIYFPASIHSQNDSNFGNAILSKWALSTPEKIILPHTNPKNEQLRIATKAILTIGALEIPLYSVHTETIWLDEEKRMEQVDKLIGDLDESTFVFIGGDFNSANVDTVLTLDEKFGDANMVRVSAGAEPTVEIAGIGFSADHIFARNTILLGSGVWSETQASDHYPVWVNVSLVDE